MDELAVASAVSEHNKVLITDKVNIHTHTVTQVVKQLYHNLEVESPEAVWSWFSRSLMRVPN